MWPFGGTELFLLKSYDGDVYAEFEISVIDVFHRLLSCISEFNFKTCECRQKHVGCFCLSEVLGETVHRGLSFFEVFPEGVPESAVSESGSRALAYFTDKKNEDHDEEDRLQL